MSIKELITNSLTSFSNSISKVFVQKADVVDNLTSTDTDKPLSANQGSILSATDDSLQTQINTLNSNFFKKFKVDANIATTGWYRIAKFYVPTNGARANGAGVNAMTLTLKRMYNNIPPEFHEIKFIGLHGLSEFRTVYNKSQTSIIKKIRHTYNSTENIAYIEIYYESNSSNSVAWFFNDTCDALGSSWEAIFEKTEETVSGVNVISSMDIPAND